MEKFAPKVSDLMEMGKKNTAENHRNSHFSTQNFAYPGNFREIVYKFAVQTAEQRLR